MEVDSSGIVSNLFRSSYLAFLRNTSHLRWQRRATISTIRRKETLTWRMRQLLNGLDGDQLLPSPAIL
jgi:hypothetical protein